MKKLIAISMLTFIFFASISVVVAAGQIQPGAGNSAAAQQKQAEAAKKPDDAAKKPEAPASMPIPSDQAANLTAAVRTLQEKETELTMLRIGFNTVAGAILQDLGLDAKQWTLQPKENGGWEAVKKPAEKPAPAQPQAPAAAQAEKPKQ